MSVSIPVKRKYSTIMNSLKPSAIRQLLKITDNSEIISFGGGLPSPDSFPLDDVRRIFDEHIGRDGKRMLQYGATEGLASLNETLAKSLKDKEGIHLSKGELIQTTGSQEALYMLGKIFADPGEYIMSEAPTYTGAISAFKASGIRMIGVEMDHYGMIVDSLIDTLGKFPSPKFIYVIPNFQNPTGISMSLERRKQLLEIAYERGLTIIEDDPYGSLRFTGAHTPSLKSMDQNESVVYLGTFSKVLGPGLRLGYVGGPKEVIERLNIAKQAVDLCSSPLSQYIAEEYVSGGYMEKHIPRIIELYREKRDLMIESFENYFPEDVEYTRPNGGMFLWVTRKGADTDKMFPEAVERKVVYVVGSAFYPDGDNHESMRLNYTYSSNEDIVEGIKRLGNLFESTGTAR